MAFEDNRPTVDRVQRRLSGLKAKDLAKVDPLLLQELLDASIADVASKARTSFNARTRLEQRDGNGTSSMMTFKWPIARVFDVRVETAILNYVRVYATDEIKVYAYEGYLRIFTYKMLTDTVTGLSMMDSLNWGVIFPRIPQAVKFTYAYGFGQYDPEANLTTFNGGVDTFAGDLRGDQDERFLTQLREAATCDAAASYLAQVAGQAVGLLQSVSFDGFSKSLNPQAYGPQVQALIARRDELLERRKRPMLATVGL